MFFAIATISMLGYALQNTLLVRYARKMDSFSLSFYRNASFVITLLPLLALASKQDILLLLQEWQLILLAGMGGALSLVFRFASYNYVPVGVSNSVTKVLVTCMLIILSYYFFGERIELPTLGIIVLLLVCIVWMGTQKIDLAHLDNNSSLGLTFAALTALPLAGSVFIHLHLSKTIDPYASSYFWEVSIALAMVVLMLVRFAFTKKTIQRVSLREGTLITLAAAPTIIGTGGIALAVRLGPVAVVSAINSSALVVTALLAWWMYNEKLKSQQWLAIAIIVLGVTALQFVS